jgi:hypothetical protein
MTSSELKTIKPLVAASEELPYLKDINKLIRKDRSDAFTSVRLLGKQ